MLFGRADLCGNVVAGTAAAVTCGVAALDHKARDYAMEGEAVVETLLGQGLEVFDRLGCGGGGVLYYGNAAIGCRLPHSTRVGALARWMRLRSTLAGSGQQNLPVHPSAQCVRIIASVSVGLGTKVPIDGSLGLAKIIGMRSAIGVTM